MWRRAEVGQSCRWGPEKYWWLQHVRWLSLPWEMCRRTGREGSAVREGKPVDDEEEEGVCFTPLPRCHCASSSRAVALNLPPNSFLRHGTFSSACCLETEENMLNFRWVVTGQNTWNCSSKYSLYISFTSMRLFRNYLRFTAYRINISRMKLHSLWWINNDKWVIL